MMMSGQETVLLVEDDPNDVLLFRHAFKKAQLTNPLEVVDNGDSAVDYLVGTGKYGDRSRYPLPILILLDLKLPRRSGFEVLEWLRQQPGLRRLPVVVLTSSKQSVDVNRAYDLGANSYLVKPVALDDLLNMITMLNHYWLNTNEMPQLTLGKSND
jgi:CheY-like chemotaxis protein